MSVFSLTKGSEAALSMLTRHAGTETLLLTQPARELRAEITIEPIGTADQRGQIEAVLFLREQRHTMTLQRGDGANAQHLADWVEAAANGTLDTAAAIPQRPSLSLLPCCKCGSEAISYDYAIPGSEFRYGVKCRHHGCQSVEGAETPAEAHAAWNAIQREELDEPAPAQDEREAFEARFPMPANCMKCGDNYSATQFNAWDAHKYSNLRDGWLAALKWQATRPAQTEQQPIQVTAVAVMRDDGDGGLEPDWLLEGGTAELMAGMVLVVAEGDITGDDGHGEVYAAPVAQTAPLVVPDECPHIIVFDDADRENEMFAGCGARPAAMRRWEQISQSWNAHLFVRIEKNSRDAPYPCATAAPQPEQSGLVEALTVARRELHACQAVIHYAGGFDPAYVRDAQSALKQIDAALAQATRPAA